MEFELAAPFEPLFHPARYKVFYGGRGGAKCLKRGTKVIMYDGSLKCVENIVTGDLLMGVDNTPRLVLETHNGHGKLYRVDQSSGQTYWVNEDHILSLKKSISCKNDVGEKMPSGNLRRKNGRYPTWSDITNISINDYLNQSSRWKALFRGYKSSGVVFPSQEVLIDPYLLGVWLGDGTNRELRITNEDDEVISFLCQFAKAQGFEASVIRKPGKKVCDVGLPAKKGRINFIWEKFKAYNLPNNKHVPQEYITNSEQVRLDLLAGFIDTDGTVHHNGYVVVQKNEKLLRDIKYVADTLGFRTKIHKRVSVCTNNGKKTETWKLSISGNAWRIPCKIKRKQIDKSQVRPNKDWHLSQISVTEDGIGEWFGFSLDGDHLFMLEDGTVTHNSWAFARALLLIGLQRPIRVLCCREFQSSIADSVHKLLCDQIDELGFGSRYVITQKAISGINGTEFIFKGLRHNATEIKSLEGADIAWVEEGQSVSKESWDLLIPTIRKQGSEIWISFNPGRPDDETYQRFVVQPPDGAVVVKVGWKDNPWFPETLRKEMEYCKRVAPADYLHIWEGEPSVLTEAQVFKGRYVVEDFVTPEYIRFFHGADWGFANDPTALVRCFIQGDRLYVDQEAYGVGVELDETPQLFDSIPTSRSWPIKADCARPETISYMKKRGFNISAAKKWQGSVEDGLAVLKSFEKIVLHPRCKHTIEEFQLYSYKIDKNNGDILPILVDAWNHSIDALRYALDGYIKGQGPLKISTAVKTKMFLDRRARLAGF